VTPLTNLGTAAARLDLLYQYALAVASLSDDYQQRQLGPIHLLKYGYLADLAHAERHEGETFTHTDWRFYHFGPWSEQAFERIMPALVSVGAEQKTFRSRYADDHLRYGLDRETAEQLARRLELELPSEVARAISSGIRQHGTDTADLLRHVYLTAPMLNCRPNEYLDFRTAFHPRGRSPEAAPPERARPSVKERRRRAQMIESARTEIQRRLAAASAKRVAPTPPPRYDEVFLQGTARLDQIAGESLTASQGEVEFDDSVWLSSQRRDPDVS